MAAQRKLDAAALARARAMLAEDGATQASVAEALGVSQPGLSRALKRDREGEGAPTVEITGEDWRVFHGLTVEDLADADAMLRRRGFDPAEWQVTRASMTEWGRDPETGAPYQRLKVDVRRRTSLLGLLPADHAAVPAVRGARVRGARKGPKLGVIFSDQHAPYHDPDLHLAALAFLRDVQPDFGILNGDGMDLPNPSRHRRNPAYNASPQESVNTCYRVYRDYVEAEPAVRWVKVLGNHDVRVRNFLLESSAHELATLHPAETGDPDDLTPALAVRRLLHLDRLGIKVYEPGGEYANEQVAVTRHLAVMHGERTGRGAVEKELERYGHSIAFGHTHGKSMAFRTTWDQDGPDGLLLEATSAEGTVQREASTHVGMEVGCMCRIHDGLGYGRRPDWQQGFGVVSVWEDGTFNLEHATFAAGSLFWRDRRWRP